METYNKISVVAPVSEAIEKTKILLFKPFNLEKWFVIGFCAWLASLFHQGFRFPGNYNFDGRQASEEWGKAANFVKDNIMLVAVIGGIAIFLIIVITLLLLWLNSRGHFMFLDCLAKNKAQVVEPWKKFKQQANSLFWFRLVLGILSSLIMMAFAIPLIFLIMAFHSDKIALAPFVVFVSFAGLFMLIAGLLFGIVQILTIDFVVPIMYLQKIKTMDGWRRYLAILSGNFGKTILYLLFKALVVIVVGTIQLLIVLIGCCLCCISLLLCIPYIGTVIFLPFISFMRLYSLCFLRQFGSEYDVFI
jgi:hypothetical protein